MDDLCGCLLLDLPLSVLTSVAEHVSAVSNPGQVFKLVLVCKRMSYHVSRIEGFWSRVSLQQGWRTPGNERDSVPTDDDVKWFQYYCARASLEELQAAEQRLGVHLPIELWELYRYRNGQLPEKGVAFAYDTRFLSLDELRLEEHHSVLDRAGLDESPLITYPETSADVMQTAVGRLALAPDMPASADAAVSSAEAGHSPKMIRFAANSTFSRSFGVNMVGHVYQFRGLTATLMSTSVSGFLQQLLS